MSSLHTFHRIGNNKRKYKLWMRNIYTQICISFASFFFCHITRSLLCCSIQLHNMLLKVTTIVIHVYDFFRFFLFIVVVVVACFTLAFFGSPPWVICKSTAVAKRICRQYTFKNNEIESCEMESRGEQKNREVLRLGLEWDHDNFNFSFLAELLSFIPLNVNQKNLCSIEIHFLLVKVSIYWLLLNMLNINPTADWTREGEFYREEVKWAKNMRNCEHMFEIACEQRENSNENESGKWEFLASDKHAIGLLNDVHLWHVSILTHNQLLF